MRKWPVNRLYTFDIAPAGEHKPEMRFIRNTKNSLYTNDIAVFIIN